MSYTPTTWVTGDTITATKLNKMEQGIADSGGYDLVLSAPFNFLQASNVEVLEGSVLACEQKVANGEGVNAILLLTYEWSTTPSSANIPQGMRVAKLTHWNGGYCWMTFSMIYTDQATDYAYPVVMCFNLVYDPDDGSILSINNPYKTLM